MPEIVQLLGDINVHPLPDGGRAIVITVSPAKQYVYPMTPDLTKTVEKDLAAPSVEAVPADALERIKAGMPPQGSGRPPDSVPYA